MTSIPVKYIVTTHDALDNIPIVEGQVICVIDEDGWYYDMGGERHETSSEKYTFADSDTIEIVLTPTEDNKYSWTSRVKEGSITEYHLQGNYLSDIKIESARAIQAADSAEAAAQRAASSAQLSGEYANDSHESADQSSGFATNAIGYATEANGFASAANGYAKTAAQKAEEAIKKASEASTHATIALEYAEKAEDESDEARSWATGDTTTRPGEETNNAKYYALLAQQAAQSVSGLLVPKGTILFEQLANISNPVAGWMYNISNQFVTDERFITVGEYQSAGANIYYTDSAKWDCMAGNSVNGVKGSSETEYRQGNVNITKANIGLDKVENLTPQEVLQRLDIDAPANEDGGLVGTIKMKDVTHTLKAPAEVVYKTASEYQLLTEEEKMKDVLYIITDDGSSSIIDDVVTSKYKTWSSFKIHQDVLLSATDEKVNVKLDAATKAFLIGTSETPTTNEKGTKGLADNEIYMTENPGELHVGSLVASGEIHASSVYSAVWNDFAEWFEKENEDEVFEPGTIVSFNSRGVVKAEEDNKYQVAGVCSNTYGYIVGGENLDNMNDNKKKYVPVALSGRVYVKVIGSVNRGDFIVPCADGFGIAVSPQHYTPGTVIGKAIETKTYEEIGLVKIIVMLA